jgi:hypothetical protein
MTARRFKDLIGIGLVILTVAGLVQLLCGCATLEALSNLEPEKVMEGVTPSNAVSVATTWMQSPAIANLINGILSDDQLMQEIENSWNDLKNKIEDDIIDDTPDPIGTFPSTVPEIGKGRMLPFYGRVNWWHLNPDLLTREIDYMAHRAVNYQIELSGWAESAIWYSNENMAAVMREYPRLVKMCRDRNLLLFVSIVNDNMSQSKYGNTPANLSNADIMARAMQLAKLVKDNGPDNVIVQPVAETQTSGGKGFEKQMLSYLSGFELVYNGNAGRPASTPAGYKWRAWHPLSMNSRVPSGTLCITDTGPIIRGDPRELSIDGTLTGASNPDRVRSYRDQCEAWGALICGLYIFQHNAFDQGAIDALSYGIVQHDDPPEDPQDPDDLDLSRAKWYGPDGSGAVTTCQLKDLTFDGHIFRFTNPVEMKAWLPKSAQNKNCNAYSCFFVFRNGQFHGGKYDYVDYSRNWREAKNIRGGYTGGIIPANGEQFWKTHLSLDLSRRTSTVSGIWKGNSRNLDRLARGEITPRQYQEIQIREAIIK